jgi:hypothetical protein
MKRTAICGLEHLNTPDTDMVYKLLSKRKKIKAIPVRGPEGL